MARSAAVDLSLGEGQMSQVISRVAGRGERIVISRDGNEQVAVVPVRDLDRLVEFERRQATEDIAALRASAVASGADQMTDEEIDAEIAAVRQARRDRAK